MDQVPMVAQQGLMTCNKPSPIIHPPSYPQQLAHLICPTAGRKGVQSGSAAPDSPSQSPS